MNIGITIHSGDHDIKDILDFANLAEKYNYDGFWLTEESGKEAFSLLSLLSVNTKKIRLGTGIISIYTRTPTLIAMGISTIDKLSSGRAFLGLGTGGIGFIERGHGLKIEKPIERMREYVYIIRNLLKWERFSYNGTFFKIKDFKLREEPLRKNIPIYLAALNNKMQQLAGEVADGVIVNMIFDDYLKEIEENIKIGAEKSGRDPKSIGIYSLCMTLCDESQDAMESMKKVIAFYCASPHYHHIIDLAGFGEIAKRIEKIWNRGNKDEAAKIVPDDLVMKVTFSGSKKEITHKYKKYLNKGVYPIVYPIIRKEKAKEDVINAIKIAVGEHD